MKWWFLVIVALIPSLGWSADDWHTFTDIQGRKIVAKIVKVEDARVHIEMANGRQVPVNFTQLSKEDVDYIQAREALIPSGETSVTPSPSPSTTPTPVATPSLYPRTREEIRDGLRAIEKVPRPQGVSKELFKATQLLNTFRFLCGVPSDVQLDAAYCKAATDAALTCKKNGGLSHSLGHSTESCNLTTVGDLSGGLIEFIADNGDNNRDARGHRAWCLNPPMGKVGFGSGGDSYCAMWCMDGSGKSIKGTWAYPGKGLYPREYVLGNSWSLYGSGIRGDASQPLKVEVVKLARRPTQAFQPNEDIPGRKIKIHHIATGMNAINFEPADFNSRGIYWVRVSGAGASHGYPVELY